MKENSTKCFTSVLLFLCACASAQDACGPSPCPQANGLFPVPQDCTSFYNCAHCTAYKQQCGPGTAFDPLLHVCNHIHMVDCSGSATYSRRIDERKQTGVVDGESRQTPPSAASYDPVGSRSSFSQRSGFAPTETPSAHESVSVTYPYQENHRSHSQHSGAHHSQVPARNIYRSGGGIYSSDSARRLLYPKEDASNSGSSHHRSRFIPTSEPSGYGAETAPSRLQNNNRFGSQNSGARHHSQEPTAQSHPKEEGTLHTDSRAGHYTEQDQQNERYIDPQRYGHHQNSQEPQESNSTDADTGTVAVSTRSRFNHSHITHHPEAVSYLPTHQVVYDHSHEEHHHSHTDSGDESRDPSSDNRAHPQPTLDRPSPQASASPQAAQNNTNDETGGFDLKERHVANSGFVPSYVSGQMKDDISVKAGNYGEREYVRSANQKSQESGLRNLQGQPINPDRFYTDDFSSIDSDNQESPVQLNADDLRHFQQNQAAQGGIPYVEASSGSDRHEKRAFIQPGFRSPYQYPAPSSSPPLTAAGSSIAKIEEAETGRDSEKSAQLYVEHRRRKQSQNNQDPRSPSSDSRGRSTNGRDFDTAEVSESQDHVVYVSAPPLPTPLPLLSGQRKREYHHMGYSFDHDPLKERVTIA